MFTGDITTKNINQVGDIKITTRKLDDSWIPCDGHYFECKASTLENLNLREGFSRDTYNVGTDLGISFPGYVIPRKVSDGSIIYYHFTDSNDNTYINCNIYTSLNDLSSQTNAVYTTQIFSPDSNSYIFLYSGDSNEMTTVPFFEYSSSNAFAILAKTRSSMSTASTTYYYFWIPYLSSLSQISSYSCSNISYFSFTSQSPVFSVWDAKNLRLWCAYVELSDSNYRATLRRIQMTAESSSYANNSVYWTKSSLYNIKSLHFADCGAIFTYRYNDKFSYAHFWDGVSRDDLLASVLSTWFSSSTYGSSFVALFPSLPPTFGKNNQFFYIATSDGGYIYFSIDSSGLNIAGVNNDFFANDPYDTSNLDLLRLYYTNYDGFFYRLTEENRCLYNSNSFGTPLNLENTIRTSPYHGFKYTWYGDNEYQNTPIAISGDTGVTILKYDTNQMTAEPEDYITYAQTPEISCGYIKREIL